MGLIMQVVNPQFWEGKRVFLTGHTGFKGSWLSLWLQSLGAQLYGFALKPPTSPALFDEANVAVSMESMIGDIRDYSSVLSAMQACKPEIIIHMAAQPLVRYSYQAPVETYATNVMGSVHVLEAARQVGSAKAIINVTTDKCYENREWVWGYREDEPMGGHDPYSNSKGCSELVTSAYRRSFFRRSGIALASARAGNVIGGGDWAKDRLIPDCFSAWLKGQKVKIRYPKAIRPWQHVLESLSGYLLLAEKLYTNGEQFAEAWNFGPNENDTASVEEAIKELASFWAGKAFWEIDGDDHPHEAGYLKLDSSKARTRLGWKPNWDLRTALMKTAQWYQAYQSQPEKIREKTLEQITDYMKDQQG